MLGYKALSQAPIASLAGSVTFVPRDSTSTTTTAGSVGSVTFSHNVNSALSNTVLVVSVVLQRNGGLAASTVSGVTYAGTAMTRAVRENTYATSISTEIWYLVAPTTGANNVVVTLSSAVTNDIIVNARTYYNIDQTSPIVTTGTGSNFASSISTSVTTVNTDDVIVDTLYSYVPFTATIPQSTAFSTIANANSYGFGSDKLAKAIGVNTVGWAYSSTADISHSVVVLKQSTASSVLTKTQTAIAQIAVNPTKTQASIARIANGISKTQTGISRISNTKTKTQTGVARVANIVTKTQPATSRIANNITKTQPAISRISNGLTKTQSGISRISNVITKTQTATARVQVVLTKTQTATASIVSSGALSKTQTATARIAVNLTKTQTATAKIATSVTKTQPAVSRIANSLTKTQTGISRIANTRTKTQPSISRISKTLVATQPAVSRIANTRSITQSARANITDGSTPLRKYFIDKDGNFYWVINQTLGIIEKI